MPQLYHTPSLFDGKSCSVCRSWSPISNFYTHKKNKDGRDATCKPCSRERSRLAMQRGRELNPGRNKEVCRRHYLKYRQDYIDKACKYREENRIEICAKARDYHHAHKAHANNGRRERYRKMGEGEKLREKRSHCRAVINARQCQYRKQDPFRYRASDHAKNAKRKRAPGYHTAEDERRQYEKQHGLCFWCNDPVGSEFHIDHIQPLARGGTNNADNICVACPYCNLHKWAHSPEEWKKRLLISRPSLTAHMSTLP